MVNKVIYIPIVVLILVVTPCLLGQTQVEMDREAAHDYHDADQQLDVAYKVLLSMLDQENKDRLTRAQQAWLAYRDAQADYEASKGQGGSITPVLLFAAKEQLTRDRIAVIKSEIDYQKKNN